jgi:mannose-6-phosphate isomerase-like protein (cupin superfamily)
MNPIFIKRLKTIIEHFPTGSLKIKEEDLAFQSAPIKWSKKDFQTPHAQDELYVIISGSGEFSNDGKILNLFSSHF